MLVISRKVDQSIVIGENVEVVVVGITKDGVRLGIKAPKEVQVNRREVFDAIAQSNQDAAARIEEQSIRDAAALLRAGTAQGMRPKRR